MNEQIEYLEWDCKKEGCIIGIEYELYGDTTLISKPNSDIDYIQYFRFCPVCGAKLSMEICK